MDKAFHQKVIEDTITQLREKEIDCYIILTSEGSDAMAASFLPGVGTVGSGAFIFTKEGKRYAISSSIDAQDIEESGLLDEVIKYVHTSYADTVAELVTKIAPRRVALNFSMAHPFLDGLTMGRYRTFKDALPITFEEVSADTFMLKVLAANPVPQ